MYAIVRDRGMQYRVEQGQKLRIDLMEAEPGSQIELNEVLLVGGADEVQVGAPLVEGASVRAEVLGDIKGDKIVVFKYRNKKRYRRRTGHRQRYTEIKISQIILPGSTMNADTLRAQVQDITLPESDLSVDTLRIKSPDALPEA